MMIFDIFGQLLKDVALHEEQSNTFSFKEFKTHPKFTDKNRLMRYVFALESRLISYNLSESSVMEVFNILFGYSTIRSETLNGYNLNDLDRSITTGDDWQAKHPPFQKDMNTRRALQSILSKILEKGTVGIHSSLKKTQKPLTANLDSFSICETIEMPGLSNSINQKNINLTEQMDKFMNDISNTSTKGNLKIKADYFEILLKAMAVLHPHARLSDLLNQLNSRIETPDLDTHNRHWIYQLLLIYCQLESQTPVDISSLQMATNFDLIMTWLVLQMLFVRYCSSAPDAFRMSIDPEVLKETADKATFMLTERLSELGKIMPATLVLCNSICRLD